MESQWQDIDEYFDPATIQRGRQYFDQRRVDLLSATEFGGTAIVRGSGRRHYHVRVECDEDNGDLYADCDCPAAVRGPCKHTYATLMALELGVPDGAPSPRWQHTLDLLSTPKPRDPWTRVASLAGKPVFALIGGGSPSDHAAVLRLMHRSRLASGRLSAPRALPRGGGAARFDAAGDALYARVRAAAQERYDPGERLWLRGAATRDILLELARADALYFTSSEDRRARLRPVPLEDGEPYAFRMELARGGTVRLTAEFVRGEERLPADKPPLVLACGLMIVDGALVPVDYGGAWHWAAQLRRTGPIELPPEAYPALVARLTSHGGPLPLAEPLPRTDTPPVVGRLRLRARFMRADAAYDYGPRHVPADVEFLYGDAVVEAESPAEVCVDPTSGATMPRDDARESELLQRLLDFGARPGGDIGRHTARLPQLGGLSTIARLLRDGWIVEGDDQDWRAPGALSFGVKTGIDWFELEGGLRFDDQTVALPEILKALRAGSSVVALDDGSSGILPEGLEERLRLVTDLASGADGALRFGKNQGWLLDALLAEHDAELEADEGFAALRRKIARFERIQPRDPGAGFVGALRPYQRDALGWLQFLEAMGLGGCLADDMGLGKTIMVLAHLLHDRAETGETARKPALVVAPKSLAWNWIDEARRFAPSLRVLDYSGAASTRDPARLAEHDLAVTTYGVLRRDAPALKDVALSYAILDEAQNVKNPASQAWKAARLLRADHRLALTGTPVENHLGDLWAILEFLNPGMLGRRATHAAWAKGGGSDDEAALRTRVAGLVKPVVLRRTKAQVLKDLPPRQETLLHCDMGPTQRRLYDELRDHYRAALLRRIDTDGLAKSRFHVLEALLRLRQCACHPGLLDGERAGQRAAKFDALMPLLEEVREAGSKALVFSQFTSLLALLRARLDAAGIEYAYLDGKTRKRDAVVRGFVDAPDTPLFLISLKAGGVGLNLTAADHVFLLDPWWNPAVERQAVDRTHRIGQTRTVNVYRLVATNTVEERILELQARKRDLAEAVIGEDAGLLRKLSRADLAALLDG